MADTKVVVGNSAALAGTKDGKWQDAVVSPGPERNGNGRPPPGGTDADAQPHAPG
jgi:hypothetical protein